MASYSASRCSGSRPLPSIALQNRSAMNRSILRVCSSMEGRERGPGQSDCTARAGGEPLLLLNHPNPPTSLTPLSLSLSLSLSLTLCRSLSVCVCVYLSVCLSFSHRYWYSNFSIEKMIEDQVAQDGLPGAPGGGRKVAFLSTPSLYFTMPDEIRERSFVFDVRAYLLSSA